MTQYTQGLNSGLLAAIAEIEGWEKLLIKAHETAPYSNPKDAAREHGNTMRLLTVIKLKIAKKITILEGDKK